MLAEGSVRTDSCMHTPVQANSGCMQIKKANQSIRRSGMCGRRRARPGDLHAHTVIQLLAIFSSSQQPSGDGIRTARAKLLLCCTCQAPASSRYVKTARNLKHSCNSPSSLKKHHDMVRPSFISARVSIATPWVLCITIICLCSNGMYPLVVIDI
jgi:hypothetical protein